MDASKSTYNFENKPVLVESDLGKVTSLEYVV